ncbi:hypothetical protein [Paraferrimonas sedimenticola]|uniref:Uncharacterized protein n=1 Tax=Paraferrimonas sedimenticola TaxID=375674 RepID=A0AA37VXI1_9GAMM|nr:hypothetical protein [Paraferrimonas sedimenticola]GLP95275.1 hypothetical protein GCM10007895_05810 [Paraferrimonas sedimenticola]
MSLLYGIGKGIADAGKAAAHGLSQYALMINQNEQNRLREASIERRWKAAQKAQEARDRVNDRRYQESEDAKERRHKENREDRSTNYARQDRNTQLNYIHSAFARVGQEQSLLAKSLTANFTDPVTGQITDVAGYQAAVKDLQANTQTAYQTIIDQSGLDNETLGKYGLLAMVGQPTEQTVTADPEPTPEPTLTAQFDYDAYLKQLQEEEPEQAITVDTHKVNFTTRGAAPYNPLKR